MTTPVDQRIVNLNQQLIEAADAYYKKASPIMSDVAFDASEKELKQLVAAYPLYASLATYLQKVGSDLKAVSGRTPHRIPMLSIENMYTEEDFLAQYDRFGGVPVVIEPKFDGVSISMTYVDGELTKALTRGDGTSGEDMTAQVRCTEIPTSLGKVLSRSNGEPVKVPALVEIRGELVMHETTLKALNAKYAASGQKTYANTRNLTAGTMKLNPAKYADTIRERKITIRPWDVIADQVPDSRIERLRMIKNAGFSEPEGILLTDRSQVIPALRKMLELNKTADIYRDGVVMKVDSVKTSRSLGLASKYTNYQTCFKPQGDKGVTYLREVVWQVGRTGRISPVGIVDPIVLAGATITRVNLNNITWIRAMRIKLGSRISLLRSGSVIPVVERVLDDDPSK
jgi:DNA ligase (NAD+)